MCKTIQTTPPTIRRKHSLLLTTSSFDHGSTEKDESKLPTKLSTFLTLAVYVLCLFVAERLTRLCFSRIQHWHPLFENEQNRMILSRHIAVDFLSCITVAMLGWRSRHFCKDLVSHAFHRSDSMPLAGFESRLFTYIPAAQQIALIFLAYQVKNTFDSYMWNDGPEFLFHHIFAGLTAWGSMYPGCGHFYVIFFMGISEISTSFLCILANFDDDYGVKGMAEAFPLLRIFFAILFVITFIACRTVIWPYTSYFFTRDVLAALKTDTPQSNTRRGWMKGFMVTLCGLSILQLVWLIQIFIMARQELAKLM